MRNCDLRRQNGGLRPDAHLRVWAVMHYPTDQHARNKMMRASVAPWISPQIRAATDPLARKGGIAGALLLTRLQLFANGYPFSASKAIPLVRGQLLDNNLPGYARRNQRDHLWPVSPSKMLEAWEQFRTVAPYWAAMIHGIATGRHDITPTSSERLLIFLAYSERILEMACTLPAPDREARYLLTRSEVWKFVVPAELGRKELRALPLTEGQLRAMPN
jgi:hypothetical protein